MADPQVPMEQRRVFRIENCLGRGGFGEVYRASMTTSGGVLTDVAIKVLHEGLDPRSQAVQRLRDEGKLMGLLRHPSILKCYDLSILNGRIALVTEYVEGDDLDGCFGVVDGIPTRALLQVIARIAEALKAAWITVSPSTGKPLRLIHRDVKPANIRLSVHGEVKLLDFGIARAETEDREAKTQTHTVIGSFPYMSPERFLQEDVGAPSDVFALGCVLYEGLCGDRVFRDVKLKQMYLLACDEDEFHEQIGERIAELPSHTSPEVIELVREMLVFEPDLRPSADQVSRRCDDLADDESGSDLRRWTRDREWPVYQSLDGELDGTIITEGPLQTEASVPGPPEFPPPTKAPQTFFDRPDDSPHSAVSVEIPGPLPQAVSSDTMTVPGRGPVTQPIPPQGGVPWVKITVGLAAVGVFGLFIVGGGLGGLVIVNEYLKGEVVVEAPPPTPEPVPVVEPEPDDGVADAETPAPKPEAKPVPVPRAAPRKTPVVRPEPEPEPVKTIVVVAPLPVPAPVPIPIPVRPAPMPTPRPAAAPGAGWGDGGSTPAPTPRSQNGLLTIDGSVLVELRKGAVKKRAGYVPSGTWQVFADFGSGLEHTGQTLSVLAGGKYTILCSKLRRSCSVP